MSSWCQNLISSIHNDSKWQAFIPFPFSESLLINEILKVGSHPHLKDNMSTHVDIVQLLNPQNMLLQTVLKDISDCNHYPENAIIQFEGYSSFEDKSNLIDALKDSAFKFGTVLVNQRSYSKSANKKYYSCTLACAHYGVTNTSCVKIFKYASLSSATA